MPPFRTSNRSSHWCLAAMMLSLLGAMSAQEPRATPLQDTQAQIIVLSEAHTDEARQILRLAVSCDAEVRRLIGRSAVREPLYLLPDSQRHQVQPGLIFFALNGETQAIKLTHALLRATLFRLIRELRPDLAGMMPEEVPAWLVAALHQQLLGRDLPAGANNLQFTCRLLLEANQLPPFSRLLDQPIGTEDVIFYQLYCDVAGCLLQVFRRADPEFAARLLTQFNPRLKPSDQVVLVFPEQLGGTTAQKWFVDQLTEWLYRVDRPGSYEMVRRELDQLERIAVMLPDESGRYTVRRVLIDEAPKYLEHYDYSRYDVSGIIRDLIYVMQNSPYLLRESLAMYVAALNALRQGQEAQFVAQIRLARERFARDYAYGIDVKDYLEAQEEALSPPAERLFHYVSLMAPAHPQLDIERQVGAFLDSLLERQSLPPAPEAGPAVSVDRQP